LGPGGAGIGKLCQISKSDRKPISGAGQKRRKGRLARPRKWNRHASINDSNREKGVIASSQKRGGVRLKTQGMNWLDKITQSMVGTLGTPLEITGRAWAFPQENPQRYEVSRNSKATEGRGEPSPIPYPANKGGREQKHASLRKYRKNAGGRTGIEVCKRQGARSRISPTQHLLLKVVKLSLRERGKCAVSRRKVHGKKSKESATFLQTFTSPQHIITPSGDVLPGGTSLLFGARLLRRS